MEKKITSISKKLLTYLEKYTGQRYGVKFDDLDSQKAKIFSLDHSFSFTYFDVSVDELNRALVVNVNLENNSIRALLSGNFLEWIKSESNSMRKKVLNVTRKIYDSLALLNLSCAVELYLCEYYIDKTINYYINIGNVMCIKVSGNIDTDKITAVLNKDRILEDISSDNIIKNMTELLLNMDNDSEVANANKILEELL